MDCNFNAKPAEFKLAPNTFKASLMKKKKSVKQKHRIGVRKIEALLDHTQLNTNLSIDQHILPIK